jgi:hypothetical protein
MHAEESTTSVSSSFLLLMLKAGRTSILTKKLAQILKPPSGRLEGPNWNA